MKVLRLALGLVLSSASFAATSGADAPRDMEVCFSPRENCDDKLIAFLAGARHSLDVAIYSLNLPSIANALVEASQRGVAMRVLVDRLQSKGTSSGVPRLLSANIKVRIGNFSGIMHNKYTILDGRELETGSFNYSAAASDKNAENQIYIFHPDVVARYQANFEEMWKNSLAP